MSRSFACTAAAVAFCLYSSAAPAHVGLEPSQATAGATATIAFRVGHGCGTSPTTTVKIRIPGGVTSVQPQPKPGWTLATVKGPVQAAAAAADQPPATSVLEVHWTGGSLPVEFFDTFVLRMRLPAAPNTTVYFPIVQECEVGVHRWIEVPQAGQLEPAEPTPGLRLVAP